MEMSKLLVKLIQVLQHISGDVTQKVASQSEKLCMFWSALFLSSTERWTYFFTVLFLPKNGRKVTRIARFMKNFKKLASKYYSETWNPSLPINFLTDITFDGWILTGWVELTFFSKLILNYFCSLELACLTSAFKKEIYEVEFKMFIA